MRWFDSHVHADHLRTEAERRAMIEAACVAGVFRMVTVGGCVESNRAALEMAAQWPAHVRAAVGWDRQHTGQNPEEVARLCESNGDVVVAVGEIGLDFHYDPGTAREQRELFDAMLALARQRSLPVIVHSRGAETATLEHLRSHVQHWPGARDRVGVLHCFTGSKEFAHALIELGFYISFSGILTFTNARELRDVAKSVPLERTLIETDTPWLSPAPYRGCLNEPARVVLVAQALAEIHGVALGELARLTWTNANDLFGWPES